MTNLETAKNNLTESLIDSGKTQQETELIVNAFVCVQTLPLVMRQVGCSIEESPGMEAITEEMKVKFTQDLDA
jgi:hypothetical protein